MSPMTDNEMKPEFMDFQIEYARILNSIHDIFDSIIESPEVPPDVNPVLESCVSLVSRCTTTADLFDNLHRLRLDDDSVYSHCLNVALLAYMMGRWLHYSQEEINVLTMCGLFHDIGKTSIPDEVLNKPGKYTDEEFALVKQHPVFSYKLLEALPVDERVKKAALQHHELCDGSGYPNGITAGDIEDYSGIIAIADVYDAMTAARSYRSPLCAFQAIGIFEKDGLQKYHPKYILTFLNKIATVYQSRRVLLNNGKSANILMISSGNLTKPLIQLDDGSVIDMVQNPELEITRIL